ncbi:zinc finger HIT domain-containing protein 1-like [Oppia nitens]|uniref:zinc finger HIT domain-containing protein 1-like n=1 Tax=Oppia nitens TaxID=1686743 RepID=UPI0023DBCBC0|nr:zinc finger HIT domain-containing protein 1-like [Oppia nitens]
MKMSAKQTKMVASNRQSLQRQQYRVLDESGRNRRKRNQLDQLERDNFHEDPHANLAMHKKAPKFEDNPKANSTGVSSAAKRHQIPRSRMLTINNLIEEDSKTEEANYISCTAPSPDAIIANNSEKPLKRVAFVAKRHFCSVCGFDSNYTCVNCGMRYCCVSCLKTHRDTRCLKWTT